MASQSTPQSNKTTKDTSPPDDHHDSDQCSVRYMLKVLFWNARSVIGKQGELEHILSGIDIFMCVESWLKPHLSFHVRGYKSLRLDRPNQAGGGLLFLYKNHLSISILNYIISPTGYMEILAVKIHNMVPSLNLVLCYRPPNNNISLSQDNWDKTFEVIT